MSGRDRGTRNLGQTAGNDPAAGWLVPRAGKRAGQIFPLFETNVVGTAGECHVRFEETGISGRHAEVAWHGGAWVVTDLASLNGTWINGSRVAAGERHVGIADNDIIKLGELEVTFKCI